jgi:serine/threonine protein kinase
MKKIGGYEVIEKIGEGGMATVYKGRQVSLDRPVAIKVLSKKLIDSYDVLERFNRESLIIAGLNHPNIIHVIDRGVTRKGMPYFVMDYVEGTDLAQVIREGSLDTNRKLDVIIQTCKALSYAHRNGVIHRDIKPANVLIHTNGNVLVLDFGIAKFLDEGGSNGHRTRTEVIMGSLDYMSPEQRTATSRVTAASDLYSLGVLMYELFTGAKPVGHFRPPSEINPTIPEPLEEVMLRCLDPDPGNRLASADEIKERLLKILQGAHLPRAQKERATQAIPKVEDRFTVLDVIKEDRYGAVYLYQDKADHNLLVIKKRTSTNAGLMEAKLLTTLKHKNIVNILGSSRGERLFIIVMEYLSGGSLKERLIQPFPLGDALRAARDICYGLSFAHKNRIVHGNLRPSNILFTESGQVKITDFGLEEHYAAREVNLYNVYSEPKSPQADIFAVGTIFYQMLTGSLPAWKGTQIVPHDYLKMLPIELQEIVTQMLSHDRGSRYSSFDQVIVEIDALLATYEDRLKRSEDPAVSAHPQRPARKQLLWTILLFALLLVLAVAYLKQAGDIKTWADEVLALWGKFMSVLWSFLRK